MAIDLNQCNEACFGCIKNYKNKHTLKKGEEFDIKCNGIPKDFVPFGVLAGLPPDDHDAARAVLDPVTWAKETLDWHCLDPKGEVWKRKNPEEYYSWVQNNPGVDILGKSRYHRPYQAEMLRCLHGDTNVFMSDGTTKKIKDIVVGDKVVTYNEKDKSTQTSCRVLNKWNNGIKDIYRIELNNGDILKATSNHPILSWTHEEKLNRLVNKKSFKNAYKSLEDGLSVGDKIYTLNKFDVFCKDSNIYVARLMGYIVSGGYVQNSGNVVDKHVVGFQNTKQRYVEEFADLVEHVFRIERPSVTYCPSREDKDGIVHDECWSVSIHGRNHILLSTLRKRGCTDNSNRELSLLRFAFFYNKEALSNFFNRCWSGNGCIYGQNNPTISIRSDSKEFLKLYRLLLKKIDIYASYIHVDKNKASDTVSLSISRAVDIEKFLQFVGLIFGKEIQCGIALNHVKQRTNHKRYDSLKTLSKTSIKRIEYIGKEEVWDIEVDKMHNFIADGVVVHNCTAKRKVFRIGRQCLTGDSKIALSNGKTKAISKIKEGDIILSLINSKLTAAMVTGHWNAGRKTVYKIKTKFGHVIKCSSDHRFYIKNEQIDKQHNCTIDSVSHKWLSIDTGLKRGSRIAVENLKNIKEEASDLSLNLYKDLLWDYVLSIEKIGVEETWDIEVDGPHNFIANGILTHNSGKCLVSGTKIQMADGTQKCIELVNDEDLVVSVTDNYKTIINKAFRACNGEKDVLKIRLTDGREIEATYNHPFLSRKYIKKKNDGDKKYIYKDEWIESKDLDSNSYLAVPRNVNLNLLEHIPNHYMTILGCIISDIDITNDNYKISNADLAILERFKEAEHDFHTGEQSSQKHLDIKEWFKKIGLCGLNSDKKYIPDFFMTLCDENAIEFLKCIFACNGRVSTSKDGNVQIRYSTRSEKLSNQVVALLARFNIYSKISRKVIKLNGRKYHSQQVLITRKESISNFRNKIGILGKEKAVEKAYHISQLQKKNYETEAYEDNDIVFVKIQSIVHVGKKMTWDLTVPETHNFIANNIITHNTESIVVSMLYHLFTKPHVAPGEGFSIIVITPYQTQIALIFERLMQLINSSSSSQNALRRHVKAPVYTIELHNNSTIRGFTAGTKSGGNAEAVRGQHGNMLVFDEADFLSSSDMDAALSIVTNYPEASVWMSSTPSGKRDRFYQTCMSKLWKEFYYSSRVNPMWNKQLDSHFREDLTEIGYRHEIEADFGEQEEGVFQNSYVQAAKSDYTYGQYAYNHSWTYTVGVDWNDTKNGTTIAVMGFDPSRNKFVLVDRYIVSREGWTQTLACQKITEVNRLWKPLSIYLDAGYGGTQYEVLRAYGFACLQDPTKGPLHPDSKLPQVLEQYDFGSRIETHDIFTGQPTKKDAKPFLVESTVRRFEAQDILIPETDDNLYAQLLGYVVDRVTQSGRPVYKANDEKVGDHLLDAVMLSIVAFVLENTPLGKPKFETGIVFSGKLGEQNGPMIYEGDTVIHADLSHKIKEEKNRNKPSQTRAQILEQKSLLSSPNDLPANHIQEKSSQVGVWAWDGFGHDKPKPKIRSLSQAQGDARKRQGVSSRITGRPKRKNI